MRFFADSSVLIKLYIDEVGSVWTRSSLDVRSGNICYASRATCVEVAAGLARRFRDGSIDLQAAQQSVTQLREDFRLLFWVMELTPHVADSAMDVARRRSLRAYDAVQLATALDVAESHTSLGLSPPTFLSADVRLNAAARAEGLAVDDPNQHP